MHYLTLSNLLTDLALDISSSEQDDAVGLDAQFDSESDEYPEMDETKDEAKDDGDEVVMEEEDELADDQDELAPAAPAPSGMLFSG